MVIAINNVSLFDVNKRQHFFKEIFSRIIHSHPETQFIFISKKRFQEWEQLKNVSFIHTGEIPLNKLHARIYFRLKFKKILKETNPDILIHDHLFTAKTPLPQLLFLPDVTFMQTPSYVNKKYLSFLGKRASTFFTKARNIIVSSNFEKNILFEKYPYIKGKIKVIYEGKNPSELKMSFQQREGIKEKYTSGNEYFIYAGSIGTEKNLTNLLKAFSSFKKRQRSSMQLIIAGDQGNKYDEFMESFLLYKFNKEVKIFADIRESEIEKMIAASYAMVCPSVCETSVSEILTAMKCNIPVLAASSGAMPEICTDAALYFDGLNYKDMAEKMMQIFKDEDLRKSFIEKGSEQVKKYDWNKSAELFWKIVEINRNIK